MAVVKYLISKGADIESRDKQRLTPLHYASKDDQLEVVKYLISIGANIESKALNNKTPLHYAASKGHLAIMKYLISKGANIVAVHFSEYKKTKLTFTPLSLSKLNKHDRNTKYLISIGAVI